MSRTVASHRDHTAAVLALLQSELNRPVGLARAPDLTGQDPLYPYAVLYRLDDAERDGPLDDDEADVRIELQVTSVSDTPESAEVMSDNVTAAMLNPSSPLTVTGRSLDQTQTVRSSGVVRDDAEEPPLFYVVDIFAFMSRVA